MDIFFYGKTITSHSFYKKLHDNGDAVIGKWTYRAKKERITLYNLGYVEYSSEHKNTRKVYGIFKPHNIRIRLDILHKNDKIEYIGYSHKSITGPCQLQIPFNTQKIDIQNCYFFIVNRFYYYDLKKESISPQIVFDHGKRKDMDLLFQYFVFMKKEIPPIHGVGGPLGPGHDQYGIYYEYPLAKPGEHDCLDHVPIYIHVPNIYNPCFISMRYGYTSDDYRKSLQFGNTGNSSSYKYYLKWNSIQDEIPNPFQKSNPNTNCYASFSIPSIPSSLSKNIETSSSPNIQVYRLDRISSSKLQNDEYLPGICSINYLYSFVFDPFFIKDINQCLNIPIQYPYGLLQMRIPRTNTSDLCKRYKKEDVEYWSVSSNLCSLKDTPTPSFLSYWTVNVKMMKELDPEYGYVFWAPYEAIPEIYKNKNLFQPPILSWGKIKGYLLQTPTLAFIFRYKNPSFEWKGNPIFSYCPLTFQDAIQNPIGDQLKEKQINWCPQLFGDQFHSLEDMLASSSIGGFEKP